MKLEIVLTSDDLKIKVSKNVPLVNVKLSVLY